MAGRAVTPTEDQERAEADQRRAAEREAREIAQGIGRAIHGDGARSLVTLGPIVTRLLVRHALAERRTCVHLSGGPRPTYCVAWLPGVTVCEACVSAFAVADDDPDAWQCDGCGTNVHGGIAIVIARIDRLIMCVGMCRNCRRLDFPGADIDV